MNRAERSPALEGLRGYAAFLVFLVHAFGLLATRLYGVDVEKHVLQDDSNLVRAALVFLFRSHYGVDLFFVLSGFLMGDLALRRWKGTRQFLRRRSLRIYPAYAVSTLVVGLVVYAWLGRQPTGLDVLANVVLLQGFFVLGVPAINPTSWSLTYEAAFYGLVPLLAWATAGRALPPRRAAPLLLAAFLLLVAVPALLPEPNGIYFGYFALFVPGIALGLLDEPQRLTVARSFPLWIVACAWIAFTLCAKFRLFTDFPALYFVASGIATGLVLLKACDAKGGLGRLLSTPGVLWLGRHSYSFFLIHYVVVHLWGTAILAFVKPDQAMLYSVVFLVGALALSLLAAWGLFQATERFYFRPER